MHGVVKQLTEKAKPITRVGMNLLFPPRCPSCDKLVDEPNTVCHSCFSELQFISDPYCACCGDPFPHDMGPGALCARCSQTLPAYDSARAVVHYDERSRHLITQFKYADKLNRLPGYTRLLLRAGRALCTQCDLILPVPLHPKRLRQRKYNQSALLAYDLAKKVGVSFLADGLVRVEHTPPQASLPRDERLENVRKAFRVNHTHAALLRGKRVLLVDDVLTTGATVESCAKQLRSAGVEAIHVLTIARTVLT